MNIVPSSIPAWLALALGVVCCCRFALARRMLVQGPAALGLVACAVTGASAAEPPRARDGVLDARGWDFVAHGPLALDGQWAFNWDRFDAPAPEAANQAPLRIEVPDPWTRVAVQGAPLPRFGRASYHLRVDCDRAEGMAVVIPLQHSAYDLYANGRLLATQGSTGARGQPYAPAIAQQTVPLDGLACPLRLTMHLANHDHVRAGLVRSIELGEAAQLTRRREAGLVRDALSAGGLLVMGVLPILFFLGRRREWSALWFGLFCVETAAYELLSGERVLIGLADWIGFSGYLGIVFGGWFLGLVFFTLFVHQLFPRGLDTRVVRVIVAAGVAAVTLIALAPPAVFTLTSPLVQGGALLVAGYLAFSLGRLASRGHTSAGYMLAGLLVLVAAIFHDVWYFSQLLSRSLVPWGIFIFAAAPAIVLAARVARALTMEELRTVEQRSRVDLLLRSTRAGLIDWDSTSGRIRYSERYLEMLGLPADSQNLPPFFEMVHPEDRDAARERFLAQLRDRGVRGAMRSYESAEFRMLHADGRLLWVHAEGIGVCGDDGRTLRFVGSFIDITRIKSAEQALGTERERLRLLVRSTKAGFGDWDAVRDVVTYTDRFKEMLGHPPDADTSTWPSIFELMHPDDRERAREEFRLMIRRKPTGGEQEPGVPMSYRLRRLDGSYVWIHAEGIAQVDEEGRTVRFITCYMDVTHFREQEEALRASRDQIAAQAAELELRNEALAENVRLREEVERIGRHDIKTPLNSIIAVPRLLREERSLSHDQDELLGVVERAGYRILSMVNLSLDLYKMENGSYIFRPDAVDLRDLVDKVWADLRSHAASKDVGLDVQEPARPAHAWAEELLCYSLLANLLKNAVEASPAGQRVLVRFEHEAGEAHGHVRVFIRNAGEVPLAVRANFFRKYATSGKASGTGLGAYSARLMARVQDGELSLQTGDGQTTLCVRLNAAAPDRVPPTARHVAERRDMPALPSVLPAARVLLVDDDEYNLLIVRRFLPSPLQVQTAINGRVALDLAAVTWPQLVIMDLDMPVMGGLQTVGELRAMQAQDGRARCHMVALSSHDDEATRAAALAAGFDAYLTKPVTREMITQTLLDLVGALPQAMPVPVIDEDLRPVLPGFIASRGELVEALLAASAAGQREELRRLAHRLAGSLALYGFTQAGQMCRDIEQTAASIAHEEVQRMARLLGEHLHEALKAMDSA